MKNIVVFMNGERGKVVASAIESEGHEIIETFTPQTFPSVTRLKKLKPNLSVVAGFPVIFPKEMIYAPKYGTINCHAGPVPSYRGGSPLNWQIINGASRIWVSLLQMDEGLDTGPVIGTTSFPLEPHETIADAHEKANIAFAEMVVSYIWLLEHGYASSDEVYTEPQLPAQAAPAHYKLTDQKFYGDLQEVRTWPQRNDDMGRIDPTWSAERIHNFIRALTHPYPGAWLKAGDGKRVRIWSATVD